MARRVAPVFVVSISVCVAWKTRSSASWNNRGNSCAAVIPKRHWKASSCWTVGGATPRSIAEICERLRRPTREATSFCVSPHFRRSLRRYVTMFEAIRRQMTLRHPEGQKSAPTDCRILGEWERAPRRSPIPTVEGHQDFRTCFRAMTPKRRETAIQGPFTRMTLYKVLKS